MNLSRAAMCAVIVGCMAFFGLPAAADEAFLVEPGKWAFKSTTQGSMNPEHKTQTSTECITDSEITPEQFTQGMPDCTLSDVVVAAANMSWTMICQGPGGQMQGNAEFTSTGSAVEGTMNMTMQFGGQSMQIQNTWQGTRTGPCD